MSLKNMSSLIDEWVNKKLNKDFYEANQIELKIIEKARVEIQEDLGMFNREDLLSAISTVKDLFTAYNEITSQGANLGTREVILLSDIKGLKIKRQKWDLSDEEEAILNSKENELRIVQLKLKVYNHLVNFNIPEAIELYCESEGDSKLEILMEIYKFIDEDGFNNLSERKTCINE